MESLENKVFVGYCRVSIKGQSERLGVSKSALYVKAKANGRYPGFCIERGGTAMRDYNERLLDILVHHGVNVHAIQMALQG